jgi:oligopeptide transport system substrate-binding protein
MAAALPDVSDGGKTYTIQIKEGLKWSGGDDLSAEDFVLGIQRTCNPEVAGEYQYVLTNVVGCDDHYYNEAGFDQALESAVSVKAMDGLTLQIQLQEPQPTFTIILSLWPVFPAPAHLLKSSGDEWPTDPDKLAYNGPYMLKEYEPGTRVVLVPNPNWAGEVKPTLDRLVIRFIDDLAVAANAYRAGELDETIADVTQLSTLRSEFGEGEEYFTFLAPTTRGLQMQLKNDVLADTDVRLALARAIDRVKLNQVVAGGGNEPTTSWIPMVSGGDEPDAFQDSVGFDEEAARLHLTNAGYPDGDGFPKLSILVSGSPASQATGEFLQQAFKQILNIDIEVEPAADGPTLGRRIFSGQFDLFFGGWTQDYPDPESWVLGLFETGGTLNNYNCSLPEIDELVEKARFNTDQTERLSQYRDIDRLIVSNACGVAPLWHENNHWLIKLGVVGMRDNLSGQDMAIAGDWAAENWGVSELP